MSADRMERLRQRKKEEGRERLELWPLAPHKPLIKRVATSLDNELFDKEELEMWLRAMEVRV